MSIDRWVMRFAGTVVLVSLLLAHFVSPQLALADGLRRRQPVAVVVHGLLPAWRSSLSVSGIKPGNAFS